MDSDRVSGAEAARRLGTSLPRVVRALDVVAPDRRQGSGRFALTEQDVERLAARLGVAPRVAGLTSTETKALAALGRAPLGLIAARGVAGRSGISPTAASRALRRLQAEGLASSRVTVVAAGRARRATLWQANRLHPSWGAIAPTLRNVRAPQRRGPHARRVPESLRHLFWNTAEAQLDVERGGAYLARRLLRTMDPEGLAWGSISLTADDWREAARGRGLEPPVRALAENLARASVR